MADEYSLSGSLLPVDATAPGEAPRRSQLAAPWTIRTTSVADTVAVGEALWVDASGAGTAGLNIALPGSPTPGQRVLVGKADAVTANPVRIVGTVNGDVDGARIVTPGASVTLIYTGVTLGWRVESTNMGGGVPGAMAVETGTSFRAHLAQTQTVPSGGLDQVVWFPTVTRPSGLVTPSSYLTGTKFTLGRAGLWMGTTTVRLPTAASGECYVAWVNLTTSQVVTAHGGGFGGSPGTRTVPLFDWCAAGEELFVTIFHSAGADRVIDHNNGQWANVKLGWVHD